MDRVDWLLARQHNPIAVTARLASLSTVISDMVPSLLITAASGDGTDSCAGRCAGPHAVVAHGDRGGQTREPVESLGAELLLPPDQLLEMIPHPLLGARSHLAVEAFDSPATKKVVLPRIEAWYKTDRSFEPRMPPLHTTLPLSETDHDCRPSFSNAPENSSA